MIYCLENEDLDSWGGGGVLWKRVYKSSQHLKDGDIKERSSEVCITKLYITKQ